MNNRDYSGKSVWIGIDVHRRQYTVCCRCEGEVVKRASIPGYPVEVLKFIRNLFEGAKVSTVYEAGFSGFVLHRVLTGAGIHSIVVHAAAVEVSLKKSKTDKRDAQRLSVQLEGGRLRGIRIPTEEEEKARLLPRTREQLVRARTRLKNQIRMRLHYFGLIDPLDRRSLSRLQLEEIRAGGISVELETVLKSQEALWSLLDQEINGFNKSIKASSCEKLITLYLTVPGFGQLIALTLARELGDMSQFKNEKELFSFTGLTPSEFTTDDARHLGHITRQGSARLRHLLVQAAWVAIKKDRTLTVAFNRIAARAGKKKAIVAIARKLIGRTRAVAKRMEGYKLEEQKLAA